MDDLIKVMKCSDVLTKLLEDELDVFYRNSNDGSDIINNARKLKETVLKWLDESFTDIQIKDKLGESQWVTKTNQ